MHKQKEVTIEVDDKIQPLIQFIYDRFAGLIPIASCIGGNNELNESSDCYILLIVRDVSQLHHLMELCSIYICQYNRPEGDTGNIPTYRISIPNLDSVLETLKIIDDKFIF